MLVALAIVEHVHHDVAVRWLGTRRRFATCPITEGALVRLVVQRGGSGEQAVQALLGVTSTPRHEFWPDELPYRDVALGRVVGHRQVTDAYLASLARHRGGRIATLDAGLAAAHPDVAVLISA